ncbi:amino acid--tRNA ligase-related protein [Nocardia niigatensis]
MTSVTNSEPRRLLTVKSTEQRRPDLGREGVVAPRRTRSPTPPGAPEHERLLGKWALERFGSDFLAVEGHPAAKRPFYTHPQPGDPRWTNSFDLLFRGLELVAGGQRLHEHADYLAALTARGDDPARYPAYLAAMSHGMPPHGGFAIGLERWVSRLLGAGNIRWATLFPRDTHRVRP